MLRKTHIPNSQTFSNKKCVGAQNMIFEIQGYNASKDRFDLGLKI